MCTEIGPYVVLFFEHISARRVTLQKKLSSLFSFFFFSKIKIIKSGLVDSENRNESYPTFYNYPRRV